MKKHKITPEKIIESDHKNKPKMTGAEMFETAIRALGEIRNNQGHVCGMFEICTHESCRSSHASWEIAYEALNKIKKR